MIDLPCMQEVPPTEPVEEGDEGEWDTVGEPAGSRSPAPTVEELIAQLERQPPAHQERRKACTGYRCYRGGSGCRGARGGTCRGWTGRHCQHPRCIGRDDSPVKFVSAKPSRVVLG
jgi:hypothetical protein